MPKYIVTASFGLQTEIEPDLYRFDIEADDFEDQSSFSAQQVEADGGSITFTVEAVNESMAESAAEQIIYDGFEIEDSNGFTWVVDNLSFDLEEDEMSKEAALVIVRRLIDRLVGDGTLTSEEREAFDVLLQDI